MSYTLPLDAEVTKEDWKCLMKQTPAQLRDLLPFTTALHLRPTVEAVVEHNVARLRASGQPVATIKAVHKGATSAVVCTSCTHGVQEVSAIGLVVLQSAEILGFILCFAMHFITVDY